MIDKVEYVVMSSHHLDDVLSIEFKCNPNPWTGSMFLAEMASPTHTLLVAIVPKGDVAKRETVIGFAGGQIISDEFHIHSLAVDDQWRRNQVGKTLIEKLIAKAKEVDAKSATLEVRVSNSKAIGLYEMLGFNEEGVRPKYYADNGEDASIMWLRNLDHIDGLEK